jgi:hypothetical protein
MFIALQINGSDKAPLGATGRPCGAQIQKGFGSINISSLRDPGDRTNTKLELRIMFLGLRTASYRVTDINKGKEWYSAVLGFGPYFDEPFYVGFNVAGYELGLQQLKIKPVIRPKAQSLSGASKTAMRP